MVREAPPPFFLFLTVNGVRACQAAAYLCGGEERHGELQQAQDLVLHGGQGALAQRQRLGGRHTHTAHTQEGRAHKKGQDRIRKAPVSQQYIIIWC